MLNWERMSDIAKILVILMDWNLIFYAINQVISNIRNENTLCIHVHVIDMHHELVRREPDNGFCRAGF